METFYDLNDGEENILILERVDVSSAEDTVEFIPSNPRRSGRVSTPSSTSRIRNKAMASGFEIKCANKNQQGFITRVAGVGWTMALHEAIVQMNNQQLRLNILVDGKYVDVGVRGDGFNAYLALEPDGFPLHRLTTLPSC